jgi:hypothetical protein
MGRLSCVGKAGTILDQAAPAIDEAIAGAVAVTKLGIRVVPVWGVRLEDGESGRLVCACPMRAGCTSPGKHPIESGWQRLATLNENRIAHWAKLYGGCNFGALGDDLITVDIDPKNGGALADLPSWVPKTNYVVATGGGGWHLGFRPPEHPVSNAKLRPGIDLKATGGYVVCPGSMHVRGQRYVWVAMPRLDAWVPWPDLPADQAEDTSTRSHLTTLLSNPAQVGDRNNWLAQVAGHYAKAFSHRDAFDLHVQMASSLLDQTGLGQAEVDKLRDSIWAKEQTQVATVGSWTPFDLGALVAAPPSEPERFGPAQMLYRGEVHWLAGEPESGKSILAYAAAVQEIGHEHAVLLLDEDAGVRDAASKLGALGATPEQLRTFMVYLPPTGRDLFKDWDRLTDLIVGHRPTMVILDAAADHLAASNKDEDRARDVTQFINRVLKPLAQEHGCCVVVIDHKTKGDPDSRYARASGAKLAKAEVGYNIAAPEPFNRSRSGRLHVVCTKDKPGYIGRDTSWMVNVIVQAEGAKIRLKPGSPMAADQTREVVDRRRKAAGGSTPLVERVRTAMTGVLIPESIAEISAHMTNPPDRSRIQKALQTMLDNGEVTCSDSQPGLSKTWRLVT